VQESKIELHDRLRRQGQWNEAAVWKDAKIKELRAQGMKRTEAKEEAWHLMAEKYPPPPPVSEPDELDDDEEWDDEDDEEWDDEGVNEPEQDRDGYKPNPEIIATARKWLDDPETYSNPNSPFHQLLRRIARDKAMLNAYIHELVKRHVTLSEQQGILPSAASEAENGRSTQA
jgi:hypothetical protein